MTKNSAGKHLALKICIHTFCYKQYFGEIGKTWKTNLKIREQQHDLT